MGRVRLRSCVNGLSCLFPPKFIGQKTVGSGAFVANSLTAERIGLTWIFKDTMHL